MYAFTKKAKKASGYWFIRTTWKRLPKKGKSHVRINKEFYREAKERRGQLKLGTVMAAEGKSPLLGPIINMPTKDIDHNELYDVIDEHEWIRIPFLDAQIIVVAKLNGQVYFMTNNGATCLSDRRPGIRKAHWYLSSNFYLPMQRKMANDWIVAGFWTLNARTYIYDFPTPFQVFEMVDPSGRIAPYHHMRMLCELLGMHVCPTSDDDWDVDLATHPTILRKESYLPDSVDERFACRRLNPQPIGSKYATRNMPDGLIQCELPPPTPDSQQMKITPILKQLGLPY